MTYYDDGTTRDQNDAQRECEQCSERGDWKRPLVDGWQFRCVISGERMPVCDCPAVPRPCVGCIYSEGHMEYAGADGLIWCREARKQVPTTECWSRPEGTC